MTDSLLPVLEEFHSFEVDTNIVNDLIYRQNGTISTALRELVMNAFDANSKKVEILLWAEGFEIKDSGDGFEDEASILRNFKRFGTPHVDGDAIYGRFRIGRGQVMAFAKTTWHSKNYQMITDIRSGDAGFALKKDAVFYDGCHVFGTFYKSLESYELSNTIDELSKLVRYSPWPVFINQIQVNSQSGIKWDYEDDQIKISFNPKGRYGIHLYSLGILVKELQMYRYGIAADVVTKQAMQLNMARNEINENDPLWQHVHQVLRAELRKKQLGKNRMTESERHAFIDQYHSEEICFDDIVKLPLLKDVRGKSSSFEKELKKNRPWTLCEDDQIRIGDKVSTQGNAFVISRSELDIWRVKTIEELISTAQSNLGESTFYRYFFNLLNNVKTVSFEEVCSGINNQYTLIELASLNSLERAQRNTLQYVLNNMCKRLAKLHDEPIGARKLHIGDSHAIAWTDSSTFVAINRKTLSLFDNSIQGLTQLAAILLHELTHRDGSINSNGHDMSFYESFHDTVICASIKDEVLGNAIISLRGRYITELENLNLPFPKWLADRDESPINISLFNNSPSKLLIWFLNLIEFPMVKGRGKIELYIKYVKLWDLTKLVNKRIDAMLRKHNFSMIDIDEFSYLSDYRERIEKYVEARIPLVKAMLEKEGIVVSDSAAKILSNFPGDSIHRNCSFGGLSVLTEEDSFGVKSLENDYRRQIKTMAGKGFNFSSNFHVQWLDRNISAENFADIGKEGRFAHYKVIIERLVDGITDPIERSEFLDRFFNDAMKKSMNKIIS